MSLINEQIFLNTALGATSIVSGVVIKNTYEQLGDANNEIAMPLSIALFIIGWVITAYNTAHGRPTVYASLCTVASIGILGVVMYMKYLLKHKKVVPLIFPITFGILWVVLGYSVASHLHQLNYKILGILSGVIVILSTFLVLPWQRNKGVVDGAGMPLFVLAWGIICYLNSLYR